MQMPQAGRCRQHVGRCFHRTPRWSEQHKLYATKTTQWSFVVSVWGLAELDTHEGTQMLLGSGQTCYYWEKREKRHEGGGRQRAGKEDRIRVHLTRVVLKTPGCKLAAAWQKLAHSRDRLLGEFYQAPSAKSWSMDAVFIQNTFHYLQMIILLEFYYNLCF